MFTNVKMKLSAMLTLMAFSAVALAEPTLGDEAASELSDVGGDVQTLGLAIIAIGGVVFAIGVIRGFLKA